LCEGQADLRLDGGLDDAFEAVLDRIFHRRDVEARGAQGIDDAVERRALAGTGGTCDEDHAVGATEDLLEKGASSLVDAELL